MALVYGPYNMVHIILLAVKACFLSLFRKEKQSWYKHFLTVIILLKAKHTFSPCSSIRT